LPTGLHQFDDAPAPITALGRPVRLEVDGGIKVDNIRAAAQAGADTFVAGSAIFGSRDYAATIREMRQQIALQQQSAVSSARGRA
jgi:ribulose-phosphate 3-epimerase